MWANAQRNVALPNTGDAIYSTPQSLADDPLKFAGVPQTPETISAISGPVHHIMRTCGGGIAV